MRSRRNEKEVFWKRNKETKAAHRYGTEQKWLMAGAKKPIDRKRGCHSACDVLPTHRAVLVCVTGRGKRGRAQYAAARPWTKEVER